MTSCPRTPGRPQQAPPDPPAGLSLVEGLEAGATAEVVHGSVLQDWATLPQTPDLVEAGAWGKTSQALGRRRAAGRGLMLALWLGEISTGRPRDVWTMALNSLCSAASVK